MSFYPDILCTLYHQLRHDGIYGIEPYLPPTPNSTEDWAISFVIDGCCETPDPPHRRLSRESFWNLVIRPDCCLELLHFQSRHLVLKTNKFDT